MKAIKKLEAGPLAVKKISRREEAALNKGGLRMSSVLYDFSLDAGAIGTVTFGRMLPAGAIVTRVIADEQTPLTSGGLATLQLQAGATDLTDALAFDTGFGGTAALALASSATAIKLAAASELQLEIAGATVTAGKVRLLVEYMLPNDL
jgi:hypothetical protein